MLELSKREQNGEHTGYFAHNCYEVLWTLLTKDDSKLTALCQMYRARLKRLGGGDLGAFAYRTGKLSLQSIVQEWKNPPETTSTPIPVPTSTPAPLWWDTWEMPSYHIANHQQNKNILVYFSSSQSPLCDKMDKKVLDTSKSFLDFENRNLTNVKLDWIRGRKLSALEEGEETQRVQLIKKFNITGYPTFMLLEQVKKSVAAWGSQRKSHLLSGLQRQIMRGNSRRPLQVQRTRRFRRFQLPRLPNSAQIPRFSKTMKHNRRR
jgi:hypothetical protein